MSYEHEQREARRILEGIENGSMTASESWTLIDQADPTLVYFIITWLRARYAHDPAAEGVMGRIIAIIEAHPEVTRIMKTGGDDSLVEWFEDIYQYRDLSSDEFIQIVVEKLEG